ncbi:hypothetical protein NA78x_002379 [Anatilimnocola sp. NA78]|uniref:hypothetical protein n=1 Tax=Anatilimnocola sp. NA78 TaxID=3415683 RepID=UPI003CE4A7F3
MFKNFWPTVWTTLAIGGFILSRLVRFGFVDRDTTVYLFSGFLVLAIVVYFLSKHRYVPYRYRKLRPDEIPSNVNQAWERLTEDFIVRGYQPAGDYELQPWPRRIIARCFLSNDPSTQGSICVTDDEVIPDFMTFFDDGRVIESIIHPTLVSRCRSNEDLWGVVQHGGNIFDLHHSHQEIVKAYQEETGAQTIDVTPDRFAELGRYAQRLMWLEWLGKTRYLGRPVPPQRIANDEYRASHNGFYEPAHAYSRE